MNKSDFYFDLPPELIAQTPIERREQSRLLHLDRNTGETNHRRFFELPELLRKGDCLILNDSRVLPARLIGKRETGGAAEIVLLRQTQGSGERGEEGGEFGSTDMGEDGAFNSEFRIPNSEFNNSEFKNHWECLVRPGRRIKTGTKLTFGDNELTAIVTGETDGGNRFIQFSYEGVFLEVLERLGKMPLPPYIREELEDSERYQTVYSRISGSAAAPTAGLHFTNELLNDISARGVEVCYITLHVGLGTFRPVKAELIEEHKMHSEYYIIPDETAEIVNRTKAGGGRIIAVGTTSCRALEACAGKSGNINPFSGFTDIFIYPGYEFKCIDGLITNFHLPESTLIMLVSAFTSRKKILQAYNEAIDKRYRFFSFGDAMAIM